MYQKYLPKLTYGVEKQDLYEMMRSLQQSLPEYIRFIMGVGSCKTELVRVVSVAFMFLCSSSHTPSTPSNDSSRFISLFPYLCKASKGSLMLSSICYISFVIF